MKRLILALMVGALMATTGCAEIQQRIAPDRASSGVWLSEAEIDALPTSGPAWEQVRDAASGYGGGQAVLSDNNGDHDVQTLAAALVAERLENAGLRARVHSALSTVPNASLNRVLELARSIPPYVAAADITGYRNPAFEAGLRRLLTVPLDGHSGGDNLLQTAQLSPNNWGTMARAAVSIIAAYLHDRGLLQEMGRAQREFLGESVSPERLSYDETSWHASPSNPAGVNRPGARISGCNVDGVLPEDQRRTGEFTCPAPQGSYPWEGLQGAVVAGVVLERAGVVDFNAGSSALTRAARWLSGPNHNPAEGDDCYQTWLLNSYGGAGIPTCTRDAGKNMGWTWWTHG